MISKIEGLWRHAMKTFTGCLNPGFQLDKTNLEGLRTLVSDISAEDVKVDKAVLETVEMQRSPISSAKIFENKDLYIGIFFLKKNAKFPIHDHPKMHGFLKMLAGTIEIDNFTLDDEGIEYKMKKGSDVIVTATRHPKVIVQENNPPCSLEPHIRNLHGITCIEGPCAFLDVISPSYNSQSLFDSYFEIVSADEKSEKVKLLVTNNNENG